MGSLLPVGAGKGRHAAFSGALLLALSAGAIGGFRGGTVAAAAALFMALAAGVVVGIRAGAGGAPAAPWRVTPHLKAIRARQKTANL